MELQQNTEVLISLAYTYTQNNRNNGNNIIMYSTNIFGTLPISQTLSQALRTGQGTEGTKSLLSEPYLFVTTIGNLILPLLNELLLRGSDFFSRLSRKFQNWKCQRDLHWTSAVSFVSSFYLVFTPVLLLHCPEKKPGVFHRSRTAAECSTEI